jgi:hypothetical protein
VESGTCQRIRNLKTGAPIKQCYNLFGAVYIVRRNFEISATHTLMVELRICLEGNALSELRSHKILLSPTIHGREVVIVAWGLCAFIHPPFSMKL